ncbi:MAG: hypothetical protein OEU36_03455 [Gammaproteobacteria bacterium]|nr:hypothetical protein [Gammaproteobacteria bacterium]
MNLGQRARKAAEEIGNILSPSLKDKEVQRIAGIIESAMTDTIQETSQVSSEAAYTCCSADRDMAHKIAAEIELAKKALLANLMSLR